MRSKLPGWILLSLLLGLPSAGAAAPMEHHDLASLWFLADHVLEAEEISHQHRIAEWNTTTTYRVSRVFKGELATGAEIEVYDDAYRLDLEPGLGDPASPELVSAPEHSAVVYLFVESAAPRQITETTTDGEGLYQKVPSGMRIVVDGGVYRFAQRSNPGAYAPLPLGPDPAEVLGLAQEWATAPVSVEVFEHQLRRAAERAERCEAALATEDVAERNVAILELLPPPRRFPEPMPHITTGFAADALSRQLQAEIGRSGDLEAYLDAMGRDVVKGMRTFDGRAFIDGRAEAGPMLLQAAEDLGRPTYQRHAALHLLAKNFYALRDLQAEGLERIGRLLADPDPWVRVAAVEALRSRGQSDHGKQVRSLLASGASAERGAAVLIAYGQAFRSLDTKGRDIDPQLRDDHEFVLVTRPGPTPTADGTALELGYHYMIAHHEWSPTLTMTAVVTDGRGRTQPSAETTFHWAGNGQDLGRGLARFAFSPPLPSGEYHVTVTGRLEPYELDRPVLETTSPSIDVVVAGE